MNEREQEILQSQLNTEKRTIKHLKQVYAQAIRDCEKKIRELSMRTDLENIQSIVYQKQYQQAIKGQLEGILEQLHSNEYATISEYLTKCYHEGYIGTMYDLDGQGIPIIMPIDQEAVTKAIQIDSKLSKTLYESLGEDVNKLKTAVKAQVSRGIAAGLTWNQVAENLANRNMQNTPYGTAINNAIRIARTEGHRIQVASAMDAQTVAKSKGADILKQWNAALDGRTRPHHRMLDGQIRETNEDFEVSGMKVKAPGYFGKPSEDCNCRCALSTRARWALDEAELEKLKKRAAYYELDKTEDFEDYKKKYLKASEEERVRLDVQKSSEGTSQEKASEKENSKQETAPTKIELEAVEYYVSGDGMYINNYMRERYVDEMGPMTEQDKSLIDHLEKATNRTHDNKVLYRSVDASAVFENITDTEYENLYNALIYSAENKYEIEAMQKYRKYIGKEITDKGFMSTTKDYDIAADFGDFTGAEHPLVLEFTNADKVKGFDLSKHMPELDERMEQAEVLLHNEQKYTIKSISAKNGNIHIAAEFVEEPLEKVGKSSTIDVGTKLFVKIPDEKFTGYALNPTKDSNKAKAFQEALGYNMDNYELLKENILRNLDESKFIEKGNSGYGMKYEQVLELTGANGKKAKVLTAWIQDGNEKRLVSVYVDERKG